MDKCESASQQQPIKIFSKFIPQTASIPSNVLEKMKRLQTKFVAGTFSSFRLAENPHLLDLIQYGIEIGSKFGQVDVKTVTFGRKTIHKDLFDAVESIFSKVKDLAKSKKHCAFVSDIWSDSVNHNSFIDLTIFYVEEFSLKHQLIAFK